MFFFSLKHSSNLFENIGTPKLTSVPANYFHNKTLQEMLRLKRKWEKIMQVPAKDTPRNREIWQQLLTKLHKRERQHAEKLRRIDEYNRKKAKTESKETKKTVVTPAPSQRRPENPPTPPNVPRAHPRLRAAQMVGQLAKGPLVTASKDTRPYKDVSMRDDEDLRYYSELVHDSGRTWTNDVVLRKLHEYVWNIPTFPKSHKEAQALSAMAYPTADSDWEVRPGNRNGNVFWNKHNDMRSCGLHVHPIISRVDRETAGMTYHGGWNIQMIAVLLERAYGLSFIISMDEFHHRWQFPLGKNRWDITTWETVFSSNYWMLRQRKQILEWILANHNQPLLGHVWGITALHNDHDDWRRLTLASSEYWTFIHTQHQQLLAAGHDANASVRWQKLKHIWNTHLWKNPEERHAALRYTEDLGLHMDRHACIPAKKKYSDMREEMEKKGCPKSMNWNSRTPKPPKGKKKKAKEQKAGREELSSKGKERERERHRSRSRSKTSYRRERDTRRSASHSQTRSRSHTRRSGYSDHRSSSRQSRNDYRPSSSHSYGRSTSSKSSFNHGMGSSRRKHSTSNTPLLEQRTLVPIPCIYHRWSDVDEANYEHMIRQCPQYWNAPYGNFRNEADFEASLAEQAPTAFRFPIVWIRWRNRREYRASVRDALLECQRIDMGNYTDTEFRHLIATDYWSSYHGWDSERATMEQRKEYKIWKKKIMKKRRKREKKREREEQFALRREHGIPLGSEEGSDEEELPLSQSAVRSSGIKQPAPPVARPRTPTKDPSIEARQGSPVLSPKSRRASSSSSISQPIPKKEKATVPETVKEKEKTKESEPKEGVVETQSDEEPETLTTEPVKEKEKRPEEIDEAAEERLQAFLRGQGNEAMSTDDSSMDESIGDEGQKEGLPSSFSRPGVLPALYEAKINSNSNSPQVTELPKTGGGKKKVGTTTKSTAATKGSTTSTSTGSHVNTSPLKPTPFKKDDDSDDDEDDENEDERKGPFGGFVKDQKEKPLIDNTYRPPTGPTALWSGVPIVWKTAAPRNVEEWMGLWHDGNVHIRPNEYVQDQYKTGCLLLRVTPKELHEILLFTFAPICDADVKAWTRNGQRAEAHAMYNLITWLVNLRAALDNSHLPYFLSILDQESRDCSIPRDVSNLLKQRLFDAFVEDGDRQPGGGWDFVAIAITEVLGTILLMMFRGITGYRLVIPTNYNDLLTDRLWLNREHYKPVWDYSGDKILSSTTIKQALTQTVIHLQSVIAERTTKCPFRFLCEKQASFQELLGLGHWWDDSEEALARRRGHAMNVSRRFREHWGPEEHPTQGRVAWNWPQQWHLTPTVLFWLFPGNVPAWCHDRRYPVVESSEKSWHNFRYSAGPWSTTEFMDNYEHFWHGPIYLMRKAYTKATLPFTFAECQSRMRRMFQFRNQEERRQSKSALALTRVPVGTSPVPFMRQALEQQTRLQAVRNEITTVKRQLKDRTDRYRADLEIFDAEDLTEDKKQIVQAKKQITALYEMERKLVRTVPAFTEEREEKDGDGDTQMRDVGNPFPRTPYKADASQQQAILQQIALEQLKGKFKKDGEDDRDDEGGNVPMASSANTITVTSTASNQGMASSNSTHTGSTGGKPKEEKEESAYSEREGFQMDNSVTRGSPSRRTSQLPQTPGLINPPQLSPISVFQEGQPDRNYHVFAGGPPDGGPRRGGGLGGFGGVVWHGAGGAAPIRPAVPLRPRIPVLPRPLVPGAPPLHRGRPPLPRRPLAPNPNLQIQRSKLWLSQQSRAAQMKIPRFNSKTSKTHICEWLMRVYRKKPTSFGDAIWIDRVAEEFKGASKKVWDQFIESVDDKSREPILIDWNSFAQWARKHNATAIDWASRRNAFDGVWQENQTVTQFWESILHEFNRFNIFRENAIKWKLGISPKYPPITTNEVQTLLFEHANSEFSKWAKQEHLQKRMEPEKWKTVDDIDVWIRSTAAEALEPMYTLPSRKESDEKTLSATEVSIPTNTRKRRSPTKERDPTPPSKPSPRQSQNRNRGRSNVGRPSAKRRRTNDYGSTNRRSDNSLALIKIGTTLTEDNRTLPLAFPIPPHRINFMTQCIACFSNDHNIFGCPDVAWMLEKRWFGWKCLKQCSRCAQGGHVMVQCRFPKFTGNWKDHEIYNVLSVPQLKRQVPASLLLDDRFRKGEKVITFRDYFNYLKKKDKRGNSPRRQTLRRDHRDDHDESGKSITQRIIDSIPTVLPAPAVGSNPTEMGSEGKTGNTENLQSLSGMTHILFAQNQCSTCTLFVKMSLLTRRGTCGNG